MGGNYPGLGLRPPPKYWMSDAGDIQSILLSNFDKVLAQETFTPNAACQVDILVLVTCLQLPCTECSCVLFAARNLYKKKLAQETLGSI